MSMEIIQIQLFASALLLGIIFSIDLFYVVLRRESLP